MTNRTVLVRLRADVSDFVAKSALAKAAVRDLNNEIDKSNDRTAWLAQGILALTPAVTTLGAGAVPVLSGMATQMMLTVAAAGTMALAFNGVGDAVGALNDYQLEPTAENLEKLELAMAKIGPAGQEFVEFLDSLEPTLAAISMNAREEMFPGVTRGLEKLMTLAPEVRSVVGEIASAIGQLADEGGSALAGPRYEEFFEYLETRAKPLLVDMGRTLGNFFDGFTNMLVAFDPLTEGFSSGLLDMSRSFATWSDGLEQSAGFQEFVDYVREASPMALDFLGSLAMTIAELAEAAAPVGAVVLPFLTTLLDVLGDLANTPLGPVTLGFLAFTSALGRLQALAAITGSGALGKVTTGLRKHGQEAKAAGTATRVGADMMLASWATAGAMSERESKRMADGSKAVKTGMLDMGKAAAPVAGQLGLLAFSMSDLDDQLGLSNTAMLTLAGSMLGPWGAAIAATVGLYMDMRAAGDAATTSIAGLSAVAASGDMTKYTEELKQANAELEAFKQDDLNWLSDKVAGVFGQDSRIDEKTAQIAAAEVAARKAAATTSRLAAEQALAARDDAYTAAMARAEDAVIDFSEAVAGLDRLLSKRATLRDYEAALDDFAKSVKDNGRNFDITTSKGRENQAMLDNIAGTAIRVAENMKGANRQKFLTASIQDLETMGRKFDVPKAQIQILIDRLKAANKAEVNPVIKVNALPAFATFRQIDQYMSNLDGKTATTYVNTITRRSNETGGFGAVGSADGGSVPKTGLPYADRHLYMLADGEEIISNRYGQADRFRADRDAGVIPGYADGGTAGKEPRKLSMSGGVVITDRTDALEAAIRRLTETQEYQTEVAERDIESRDAWTAKMADLATATTSGFQTGLFDKPSGSPWAVGSGGGWLNNLSTDISGLQRRGDLQAQLSLAGLDGAALAAALSQGNNADLSGLLASGQVQMFEDMFNQRTLLTGQVGGAAGQQAYGAEWAAANEAAQITATAVQQTNVLLAQAVAALERHQTALEDIPERVTTGVVVGGNKVARRRRRD